MHTPEVQLVDKGRALAVIVHASQAPQEVREAAALLAEYLGKSTGAEFVVGVHREDQACQEASPLTIHVGPDAYVRRALPELQQLDEDGFVIRTVNRHHLIIAGSRAHATYWGVCGFLERYVGVRWLMPGAWGEHVPRIEALCVPYVELWDEPAFLSRSQPGIRTEAHQLWGRRLRLRTRFAGSGHNIRHLFPAESYAATHPQFYPIVNGRRLLPPTNQYWKWHPCFGAEGLVEVAAEHIIQYFRDHPEERSFSLGVNDGPVTCEAETGPPMHGGRNNWLGNRHISEEFFRWANQVAERVMTEFPDRWLGCLAYTNAFQAPATVQIHPRIVVYHCYDRHKWIHPWLREEGHRLAEEWSAACPSMGWYDYTFGASFLVPRVYFHHMGEYLRYARDMGVMAMLGESSHNWAEGPKWYLMAKLYWDPDLDVDTLLDEWYELAVGADAAPYLKAYYAHWEEFWTRRILTSQAFALGGQQWLPIQDESYFDVLTAEDFTQSRRLLEQALARTESDAQRTRARKLLDGFAYYEACAAARLPDYDAGRAHIHTAEQALALLAQVPVAMAADARRRAIDAELAQDAVMGRSTLDWSAIERADWGRYSLWRLFHWASTDAQVRARVAELAAGDTGAVRDQAGWFLQVLTEDVVPVEGTRLDVDTRVEHLTVTPETRLDADPGERLDADTWALTVGDDVIPFWNASRPGEGGSMAFSASGGRSDRGCILCQGVAFGTIRKRFPAVPGQYTALCCVRPNRASQVRVVLNLWEIALADGNPSPCRIVAWPQPGVWTPLAVSGRLEGVSCYSHLAIDYFLVELEVHGLTPGEELEVADLAVWKQADAEE